MFADVVDYSEWKTGRRITGVIYATILFGLKFGLSLGGCDGRMAAIGLRVSGECGANARVPLQGIRMTISIFRRSFSGS